MGSGSFGCADAAGIGEEFMRKKIMKAQDYNTRRRDRLSRRWITSQKI